MMVGSTGAGKTTLVDGMINYVTDVSFEDDFRFTMVDLTSEEKGKESNQVLVVSAFLCLLYILE
jgi:ABC-type glutathione transport system ATPase component